MTRKQRKKVKKVSTLTPQAMLDVPLTEVTERHSTMLDVPAKSADDIQGWSYVQVRMTTAEKLRLTQKVHELGYASATELIRAFINH